MIKLIATDMDGTFLDSQKRFDPEFIDVFFKMREQGIKFVVASGNQYYRLYQKFIPLSEEMFFIAENGSYIAKGSKQLYCNVLDNGDVIATRKIFTLYPNLLMVLCGRKGAYILKENEKFRNEIRKYYCNYRFIDTFDEIDDVIIKFAIFDPSKKIESALAEIKPLLPEKLKVVTSGNEWMDIQNKEINKGIGLNYIQNLYQIKSEECAAFGDQMNDYELLEQAKYGYAMANAVTPIKEIAYEVIRSNEEQGVLLKIKEILEKKL